MTGPLSGDGRAVDGRSRLHTCPPGQAPCPGRGGPRHGWSCGSRARLDTRPLVPEQGAEEPMSRATGPRAVPRCDPRDSARHARDRVTHQRTPRCTGRPGSVAAHGARTSARADPGTLGSR